jgi:hypothetical protein
MIEAIQDDILELEQDGDDSMGSEPSKDGNDDRILPECD